ncbi:helix-turn-helix transcriptional regulator [Cupriavidus sp. WKF15]|uniref:helix-turn-helix domain-containing protein n=1 Tax=Cupriavidus sp. WKF15 TaxID=3032282 RepID=UPI0023E16548|nr:helix-turn-helix transcriptional regulator [Cupriavidus sp. WKF15]WER50712.1 helix-turn-helix transcriptional regulator [Cupriavidus sp. WKF15]
MATRILQKRSYMSASDDNVLPTPVSRALIKLGHDLSLARRRRQLTQESMAERIQTSVATLRRMEKGDSRVQIGTVVQAFFVLGELNKITDLLDTASDEIGLSLMNERLPQRVRRKSAKKTGAL